MSSDLAGDVVFRFVRVDFFRVGSDSSVKDVSFLIRSNLLSFKYQILRVINMSSVFF